MAKMTTQEALCIVGEMAQCLDIAGFSLEALIAIQAEVDRNGFEIFGDDEDSRLEAKEAFSVVMDGFRQLFAPAA